MSRDKRTPAGPDKTTVFRPKEKAPRGDLKPDNALEQAEAYLKAGKYSRAIGCVKQILAKEPAHAEALRLSATLQLKAGGLVSARAAFGSLARKAIQRQDYRTAQSLLREYLAVGPRCVPFLELLGEILEASSDPTGAVGQYAKAVEILVEDRDPEQATKGAELYKRIQRLEPNGMAANRLGQALEASSAPAATIPSPAPAPEPVQTIPTIPAPPASPEPTLSAPDSQVASLEERLAAKQAEQEERLAAQRAERERLAAEQVELQTQLEEERAERERLAREQAAQEERLAAQGAERERLTAEQAAQEERLAAQRAERERLAREQAEQEEQLVAERAERERLARQQAALQKQLEEERVERERLVREQATLEARLAAQQTEREKRLAAERLAAEQAERGRLAQEQVELQRRLDQERAERERLMREQAVLEARLAEQPTAPASEPAPSSEPMGLKLHARPEAGDVLDAETPPPSSSSPHSAWMRRGGDDVSSTPGFAEPEPHIDRASWDVEEPVVPSGPSATSPTWGWEDAPESGRSSQGAARAFIPAARKLPRRFANLVRRVTSRVNAFVVLVVGLVSTTVVVGVLTVVSLSLTWLVMEESPTSTFRDLGSAPPQPLNTSQNNGYLVLLDLGVVAARGPVQVDRERNVKDRGEGGDSKLTVDLAQVAAKLSEWYGTYDPTAQFQTNATVLKAWGASYGEPLAQYAKWIGMGFADLGFGSLEAPDEAYILTLHRLYVAEGYMRGVVSATARLRGDLETWRQAFANARTLRVKVLAAEAMNDNLAIVSGLLGRPGLNLDIFPTLAEISRPLNRDEGSLRWPMQNEFILDVKTVKSYLRRRGSVEQPWYGKVLLFFPLPDQKSLNARARYYEALMEHASRGKATSDPRRDMPELQDFSNTPPKRFLDYIKNPVDNVVVPEPTVDWKEMTSRILETEARLRLASLQVRIRMPPEVLDPVERIVQAGHLYYDPFTNFTMLLSPSRSILYSVGRDGIDDDGNPDRDVSVRLRGVDPGVRRPVDSPS